MEMQLVLRLNTGNVLPLYVETLRVRSSVCLSVHA
jgi:hypothetical protein